MPPNTAHSRGTKKASISTSRRMPQTNRKRYFDLLGLPTEIIVQILREFPTFPPDKQYEVNNLDDVHPVLALCSVSPFLKDCYSMHIGKLPNSIMVTLRPVDYLVSGGGFKEMSKRLDKRLSFVLQGQERYLVDFRIIGPNLDWITSDDRLNQILNGGRSPFRTKRLTPTHKVLLKGHIEGEISRKSDTIKDLMYYLGDLSCELSSPIIGETELHIGQVPASAWTEALREYVFCNRFLYHFGLVRYEGDSIITRHVWDYKWSYLECLDKGLFHSIDDRPSNYPKSQASHGCQWRRLSRAIDDYIGSKLVLQDLKFTSTDSEGHSEDP